MSVSYGHIRVPHAVQRMRQNSWFEKLAKAGYAAKGGLYLLIGLSATQAAFGAGGATRGSHETLQQVQGDPFGDVLVALMGLGFAAYAAFRFTDAAVNPELRRGDTRSLVKRIGAAVSGIIHASLAMAAFGMVSGTGGAQGGEQHWTARLMAQPAGQFLVGLAGAAVIGTGLYHLFMAWKADVWEHLDRSSMSPQMQKFAYWVGRAGHAARGVVFSLVGTFLFDAALSYDPSRSRGLAGALATLQQSSGGALALGIVALGLVGYALHCMVYARFFKAAAGARGY